MSAVLHNLKPQSDWNCWYSLFQVYIFMRTKLVRAERPRWSELTAASLNMQTFMLYLLPSSCILLEWPALLLIAHYHQDPAWSIREKEFAPFRKRQAATAFLAQKLLWASRSAILYLCRANFVAPFIGLKGCAADESGRNKMWIHCGGNWIFSWVAAVRDCSPKERKGHSLKKWALASCQATGSAWLDRGVLPITCRTLHLLCWKPKSFL